MRSKVVRFGEITDTEYGGQAEKVVESSIVAVFDISPAAFDDLRLRLTSFLRLRMTKAIWLLLAMALRLLLIYGCF